MYLFKVDDNRHDTQKGSTQIRIAIRVRLFQGNKGKTSVIRDCYDVYITYYVIFINLQHQAKRKLCIHIGYNRLE